MLVSDAKNEEARERLAAMTHIYDGFRIAEEDLRLRGPGDFFGARQHGLPELHIADLGADMDVLKTAQSAAQAVLSEDPGLQKSENRPALEAAQQLLAVTGAAAELACKGLKKIHQSLNWWIFAFFFKYARALRAWHTRPHPLIYSTYRGCAMGRRLIVNTALMTAASLLMRCIAMGFQGLPGRAHRRGPG